MSKELLDRLDSLEKRVFTLEISRCGPAETERMVKRIADLESENDRLRAAMKKMCDATYAIKQAAIKEEPNPDPFS